QPHRGTAPAPPPARACGWNAPAARPRYRCTAAAGRRTQSPVVASASLSAPGLRKLVPTAPDREDAYRLRRIGLDLGAQPVDVGVDRVLIAFVLVAPHGIEQVHARKHLAGLAGKEVQQI